MCKLDLGAGQCDQLHSIITVSGKKMCRFLNFPKCVALRPTVNIDTVATGLQSGW